MDAKVEIYAVVRIDGHLSVRDSVTVKEILPTMGQAEIEVERLNRLNGDKRCYYFWRATNYFTESGELNEGHATPKLSSQIPPLPGSES